VVGAEVVGKRLGNLPATYIPDEVCVHGNTMARTDAAAVKRVLMKDYDTRNEYSLQTFIDTASAIVDRVNTCATSKGYTLSTSELELIERWLAAHCYSMSDQPYFEKQTDKAYARYQGKTGMKLYASKYGQMAMTLDPSGCLESIGAEQRRVASCNWLGSLESEQTDYVDRN
jgi:hypothetical protein